MNHRRFAFTTLCVLLAASTALAERPEFHRRPPVGYAPKTVPLKTMKAKPNGVRVDFAVAPGQWKGAALWSNWGDAVYASDGNFYCSYGDHDGPPGDAFICKVDPKAGTAQVVFDFSRALGVTGLEKYSPGKIHGPLLENDGWLYFAGYRGAVKYTTDKQSYNGDHLLRYELATGKVEDLGIPVPEVSHPAYDLLQRDGKLYWYGQSQPGADIGGLDAPEKFFVYNITDKKLVFNGGHEPNQARAFFLTPDGRAYYSVTVDGVGKIAKYNPKTNATSILNVKIPEKGGIIRACSSVDSNGVAYGLTRNTSTLFAFDTNTEKMRVLGDIVTWPLPAEVKARGGKYAYTADIQFLGGEQVLCAVPHSHGGAQTHGAPVVRFDLKSNKATNICKLRSVLEKEGTYTPMGSFGAAASDDGKTILIVWNGCMTDWKTAKGHQFSFQDSRHPHKFDLVGLTLLHLP